ncbi:MAG: methyltransferase [Parafilimonas sp.]
MQSLERKPFQGILNVIRFNWHFYALALASVSLLIVLGYFTNHTFQPLIFILSILILISILFSIAATFYVYDYSNLYSFDWLNFKLNKDDIIINITAGFDETSFILLNKFSLNQLLVLDFYDPINHTEISIERARKQNRIFPGTRVIQTSNVSLNENSVDCIFIILAAHEIRSKEEKIIFFKQLYSSLKLKGKIVIVEHLRNIKNFIGYNIGFFHFFSKKSWKSVFELSGFSILEEMKVATFITVFVLQKNGITT